MTTDEAYQETVSGHFINRVFCCLHEDAHGCLEMHESLRQELAQDLVAILKTEDDRPIMSELLKLAMFLHEAKTAPQAANAVLEIVFSAVKVLEQQGVLVCHDLKNTLKKSRAVVGGALDARPKIASGIEPKSMGGCGIRGASTQKPYPDRQPKY